MDFAFSSQDRAVSPSQQRGIFQTAHDKILSQMLEWASQGQRYYCWDIMQQEQMEQALR